MSVTKRDLVLKVSDATGLLQKDVAKAVQMVFDGLADAIVKDGNVELRDFGIFETVIQKSRPGRNPRAPEKGDIMIPERVAVRFRVGKELKGRLGNLNPKSFKENQL